ncbi:MAG TPA: HAMP domain-containing sensor histidine kinase [Candidatus Dormibacteraeota bacterium]|nr:HAMP domain-containing sensor histidine kinase [Candidatus Dormibacteraeota bacterium]
MIWDRRRAEDQIRREPEPLDAFGEALESAPVMAMLLDEQSRVIRANRAARDFFEIDASRLPASLVEVTLESRLYEIVNGREQRGEAQLVHHRRTVQTHLVPGPGTGASTLFLIDITEVRRLATVRQEFVANLVHELKTPITSLRLTAESLLGDPQPKDRRRFAERLVREADLISKIIDNLRQLGDIETGAMAVDLSRFDLGELVTDSIARLAIDRPVNASIPDGLVIETDRAKLVQALDNLLDNAAKFSPPGTAIDVAATNTDHELVLSVRDRGPGISPEHWSRVFERFYKVDRARPRESGGFGLGLAITKHLVQVLGGRIWTEAAREGGQVFYIALPRKALTGA